MTGFWGPVTSDFDFCEENYQVTEYVAEFFCCISSLPIVLYGLYFLENAIKHDLGWRIKISCVGVALIGVGSVAFHGTMSRAGQMLDELPMLWSSLFFLFTAITIQDAPDSPRVMFWGGVLVLGGCISTAIYFAGGFVLFCLAYIATVAGVIGMTLRHVHRVSGYPTMAKFAYVAVGLYVGGFALFWIPEQVFCGNRLTELHGLPNEVKVTSLNDLPVPLHAWFHLTSALGPYYWLAFAAYAHVVATANRSSSKRAEPLVTYPRCWKSLWVALPVVHNIAAALHPATVSAAATEAVEDAAGTTTTRRVTRSSRKQKK